ncbi:hypothetical protein OB955_18755 [Halobacteria archaeon AArc-m2/3/4]|uniref:Uncharacterized protein n=1 Tax=Natronoglomus mannanivorans TaxID=2979990 RepID=A0ABT2QIQ1_9EURY|nr:hypothetical protein [Halobacteria archaeon AArc-m2/3/4]
MGYHAKTRDGQDRGIDVVAHPDFTETHLHSLTEPTGRRVARSSKRIAERAESIDALITFTMDRFRVVSAEAIGSLVTLGPPPTLGS